MRWLCWLGIHDYVGVAGYSLEPIPGYVVCFHLSACTRCRLVRERMISTVTPGDTVDLHLKFQKFESMFRGKE